jgi:hypothetical protein
MWTMAMTRTPSDATPDVPPRPTARWRESRWAIFAAAFLCVLWIGFVSLLAVAFNTFGCIDDSYGRTHEICESGSAARTVSEVVGLCLPLLTAVAAGALGVWRRSFRPIQLAAALLWLFPPVALALISEITTQNM